MRVVTPAILSYLDCVWHKPGIARALLPYRGTISDVNLKVCYVTAAIRPSLVPHYSYLVASPNNLPGKDWYPFSPITTEVLKDNLKAGTIPFQQASNPVSFRPKAH